LICYFYEAFSTAVRIKNEEIQENKKIPAWKEIVNNKDQQNNILKY
jgi:hypothetical protein